MVGLKNKLFRVMLGPHNMSPKLLEFANRFGRWDSVKKHWVITVPVKSPVILLCDFDDALLLACHAHQWCEQNLLRIKCVKVQRSNSPVLSDKIIFEVENDI